MYIPETFLRVNAWLCFLLGCLTNGTLLWLIAYRTEEEARPYSPILLLYTFTDLVYLAATALVVPLLGVDRGCHFLISLGPLGWLPQPFNFALVFSWNSLLVFSLVSSSVPFVYRYMVICRGRDRYGLRECLAMLIVPALIAAGHVANCYSSGYVPTITNINTEGEKRHGGEEYGNRIQESKNNALLTCILNGTPVDRHQFLSSKIAVPYFIEDEARTQRQAGYIIFWAIVSYTLVFVCGWRIYWHLKQAITNNLSEERARELNKQVSRALLLQAMVPLFVQIAPTMWFVAVYIAGQPTATHSNFSAYSVSVFAWAPVLNPLIPMWVVRNYRREVAKLLACKCVGGEAQHNTTVVLALEMGQMSRKASQGHRQSHHQQQQLPH